MSVNELFWAAAFGAALGVAGVTALLGILAWAWRRVALWWIERKMRLGYLRVCSKDPGIVPPPPNYPTPEEILGMAREMGSPLPGAAAGIRAAYDGPARQAGTVVGESIDRGLPLPQYPGVIDTLKLPNGEVAFLVRVTDAPAYGCPCCHRPMKPLADLIGVLKEQEDGIPRSTWPRPIVTPVGGIPVNPYAKPPDPPAGPSGGFPIPEDLPPPTSAS